MNEATLRFVRQHADDDVRQLAFRGSKDPEVDLTAALEQIQGRQTALRKLPSWAACEGLHYPPHLSMEQCSSEQSARYKAAVLQAWLTAASSSSQLVASAESLFVDLTGGFGVDFSFLARGFKQAVYVERQSHLCQLARHNFQHLGLADARVEEADAAEFLQQLSHAAAIFLDPARRDAQGSRTYGIADCTPDVLTLRDELLDKADVVLLKLSPMLDWRKTVADLGADCVREVHIVSVGGECKELLVLLSRQGSGLKLFCVNDEEVLEMPADDQVQPTALEGFSAVPGALDGSTPHTMTSETSTPNTMTPEAFAYLYEPNASVMKAGCFRFLSQRFGVVQVAPNSHLFLSQQPVAQFPGRSFRIVATTSMNKKELKQALAGIRQANITIRNFPLSVAQLRQRLKLADGGSHYLFATTWADGSHRLLICER